MMTRLLDENWFRLLNYRHCCVLAIFLLYWLLKCLEKVVSLLSNSDLVISLDLGETRSFRVHDPSLDPIDFLLINYFYSNLAKLF